MTTLIILVEARLDFEGCSLEVPPAYVEGEAGANDAASLFSKVASCCLSKPVQSYIRRT